MSKIRSRNSSSETLPRRRRSPADVILSERGLTIIESHHAETFHMEMDRWPFHKICWVPVGRGLLDLPRGSVPIRRNDVLLLPSGTPHRFVDQPDEPLTLVIACFSEVFIRQNPPLASVFDRIRNEQPSAHPLRAANAYNESRIRDLFKLMLREQTGTEPGHEAATQAAFTQLAVRILRTCAREFSPTLAREQALEGVVQYLEENFENAISLQDMADRCGITTRRFTDLFRQRTGTTFVDYLNRKRIDYAQDRIRETGNILYACYEAGFQDPGYFYRVFKRYTGRTPGDHPEPG